MLISKRDWEGTYRDMYSGFPKRLSGPVTVINFDVEDLYMYNSNFHRLYFENGDVPWIVNCKLMNRFKRSQ